jgi:hypothetical protein
MFGDAKNILVFLLSPLATSLAIPVPPSSSGGLAEDRIRQKFEIIANMKDTKS